MREGGALFGFVGPDFGIPTSGKMIKRRFEVRGDKSRFMDELEC